MLPEVLALDSHASLAVYRLVQEALTNVARHARATEVHLLASQDEFNLYVTVQDNGVGISETALAGSGGFGIQGMRERCAQFDGEMTIENEPGMGAIAGRAMDVVLLDLSLPDGRGLALLEHIKRHASGLPIIVYTMFSEAEYARTAFAAGASGYINKDNTAEELVLAVRRVARGGRYVSAAMADILLGGAEEQKTGLPHEQLSQRKMEVLLAISQGISLTAIAERMHLSVKTVSIYRARILAKLGASSNAQMTRYVLEHKLER